MERSILIVTIHVCMGTSSEYNGLISLSGLILPNELFYLYHNS